MEASGVYAIVNQITGTPYIGSSVNIARRWKAHAYDLDTGKHGNVHLQRAWKKYGADWFVFEVLEEAQREGLPAAEQRWLDAVKSKYNICPVAFSRAGTRLSQAHRDAVGRFHLGRKRSAETRRRMSEAQIGNQKFLGKTHTAEVRARISSAHKGKQRTPEHCAHLSAALRGRRAKPRDAAYRKHLSDAGKAAWERRRQRQPEGWLF